MSSRYQEYKEAESLERTKRLEQKKQSEENASVSQKETEEGHKRRIRKKEQDLYQRRTTQKIKKKKEENPVSLFSSANPRNFLFSPPTKIEVGAVIDVKIYPDHKLNPSVESTAAQNQSEKKNKNGETSSENGNEQAPSLKDQETEVEKSRDILLPMRVKSKGNKGELVLSYMVTIFSDDQEKSLELTAKVLAGEIFGKETVTTKVLTAVSLIIFDGAKEKKFFSNGWNRRFTEQVSMFQKISENS